MNKKSFKILIFLILITFNITRVNALSKEQYINENTNYKVVIEDDANLLSTSEMNKLKEKMIPLTEYGNIALKTIDNNKYYKTAIYASNYYHEIFGTRSGTLFLIDMDNRVIYIFSDGANNEIVTTAKANIITDNIYKYASNGQYYECSSKAFEQINTILKGEKIAEPMRYISNILISITIAFFINFVIILIKSSIKKVKDSEVLSNCNITFNVNNISATKVGTHKIYSPVSNSGGGSSSGGRSSSSSRSSSSGSGGGHRF